LFSELSAISSLKEVDFVKKVVCFSVLIISLLVMTGGCSDVQNREFETDSSVKIVKTELAKLVEVEDKLELSAMLQPIEEAILSFEVPGKIIALEKQESDNLESGDVIARLDSSQYQINAEIAKASLDQARANFNQAVNGSRDQEKETAKAAYDKASVVYQKALDDSKRVEALLKAGAVSQSDYENAQMGLSVSESDLRTAKAAYKMAIEGARDELKEAAQAGYKLAEENGNQAKLALERTVLKAPFPGTVLNKLAANGQLVAAGTPVFRFGNIDLLKLTLPVPDNSIGDWKKGDTVTVRLYGKEKQGTVTNILPATNVMTGTIGVEVTIENMEHDWRPGQVAVCSHVTQARKSIFLPVESLRSLNGKNPYVFIIRNGKSIKQEVTIGEMKDNKIQILSPLDEGTEVIVSGVNDLFDGAQVKVTGGGDL